MNVMHQIVFGSELDAHVGLFARLKNYRRVLTMGSGQPESSVAKDDGHQARQWAVCFCFNPSGRILPQNVFMLTRLRAQGFAILVVVGCQNSSNLSARFSQLADVVLWKAVGGFDMSGLRLGLTYLAQTRPGVSALWVNDSVLGPFHDVPKLIGEHGGDCDVLGFTAAYSVRPHLQSYAFHVHTLTERLVQSLFAGGLGRAFNDHLSNVLVYETCLTANLCEAGYRVRCWGAPTHPACDLTMAHPFELIQSGFPFLKRSIIGKFAADFDQEAAASFLAAQGLEFQAE